MEVQISDRTRRILEKLQPASDLGGAIEAVALEALRMKLRGCAEEIGILEAKYGRSFQQFQTDWDAGGVADRLSHAVERDYMEWEALAMEREELLGLIRQLTVPSSGSV